MLSADDNRRLTEVEGAAPMGQLLRRYWHPVAALSELDERPTKVVRMFGESLVLFRDLSGTVGLIDRRCPHRGADMSLGIPEPQGLRCTYHGWRYSASGACLEQPYEDTRRPDASFRAKCATRAYPVQVLAGLVWAYLGPDPVPCLPAWDFLHRDTHNLITFNTVSCNWLQCQENSLDPVHFEWLHDYWSWAQARADLASRAEAPAIAKHVALGFDEFEWGFIYRRLREGGREIDPEWAVGRVSLWPNAFYAGGVSWAIPVDNTTTLIVGLTMFPMPPGETPDQDRIPYWNLPTHDSDGRPIIDAQYQQDTTVWESQGAVSDRTHEHLGESDRGIILFRRRLLSELDAIAEGRDPKGVVRDPSRAANIALPDASWVPSRGGAPPKRAPFAGLPEAYLPAHLRSK